MLLQTKQRLFSIATVYYQTHSWIKMIVNPDKFQAVVLDKCRSNNIEVKFIIGSGQIQTVPSVDILGIMIDDKLNFDLHIDKTCLNSTHLLG